MLNSENKYKIGLVECGCPSPSLVGKYVMENYDDLDFCIIWRYDIKSNRYFLSLRGSERAGVDVGEIAKHFGGGGHKYASGCSLSGKYKIEDLTSFPIANTAVSAARKKIKNVIQLDTNIQIKMDFINPESAEKFVEKGWDEEKQMYYYLVYFNKESK